LIYLFLGKIQSIKLVGIQMENLKKSIKFFKEKFAEALESSHSELSLEDVRVNFLGRKGKLTELMNQMKNFSLEAKREIGPLLNELKKVSEQLYEEKKQYLSEEMRSLENLKKERFDVTAYQREKIKGSLHILPHVLEEIENIFISMGYEIAEGPEVETEFYNFDALNIPSDHPARSAYDTLWIEWPNLSLRTQTSTIQIHALAEKGAPIALVGPGRIYRHEATDATHDFVFNQVECLFVDKNVSMANLLATIKLFLQNFFEKEDLEIRLRTSYFPFVEPGIEVDGTCPLCSAGCILCKKTGWLELGGAGLVHPNVLRSCKVDPNKYSGFAWGFGLERLAMIKHGITDIRLFHSNSIDFLKQF